MEIKLLTILGARPQFIKAGNLSREISKSANFNEVIVHTGQHYDKNMSEIFFNQLKIPKPHYVLHSGGKSHGEMTGYQLIELEKIIKSELPDYVIVYGDTNSTLAGALAAVKLDIKVVHIESGLRSYNNSMPEEINRIIVDRISSILLCPTTKSYNNLKLEGFNKTADNIFNVGDIMYEGMLYYRKLKVKPKGLKIKGNFILATIHRQENTDNISNLQAILNALKTIANSKTVIIPVHPRTKKLLLDNNLNTNKIEFIDPVSYLEMIWLVENSSIVITDSGGLQKEAYFLSKPCITLREETEWTELIDYKANILVGANERKITEAINLNWYDSNSFERELYGSGNTSIKILEIIKNNYVSDQY